MSSYRAFGSGYTALLNDTDELDNFASSDKKQSYSFDDEVVLERKKSKQEMKRTTSKEDGIQRKTPEKDIKRTSSKEDALQRKHSDKDMRKQTTEYVFETYSESEVPVKPIKYRVSRDGNLWQADFPLLLDGIVDRNEYYRTILKVNDITRKVIDKWFYSDGFIGSMFVSGVLILVPYIPAVVLSVKREKKIRKDIEEYFDGLNYGREDKGYTWVLEPNLLSIVIKVDHKNISSQQKFLLLAEEQKRMPIGAATN